MKTRKKITLKDLIKEDVASDVQNGPQIEAPNNDISLDQKVDHFLVQYERESVPTSKEFPTTEGKKKSLKSIMSYLFEADADEPPTDDPGASLGGDMGGGADLGGGLDSPTGDPSGGGGGEEERVQAPSINVNNFARSMARLINNYESMVDPKRVIMNRARAYLEQNYSPKVAKNFLDILETEYDLSPNSKFDKEFDTQGPSADGALAGLDTSAPSGGGGSIGGGSSPSST